MRGLSCVAGQRHTSSSVPWYPRPDEPNLAAIAQVLAAAEDKVKPRRGVLRLLSPSHLAALLVYERTYMPAESGAAWFGAALRIWTLPPEIWPVLFWCLPDVRFEAPFATKCACPIDPASRRRKGNWIFSLSRRTLISFFATVPLERIGRDFHLDTLEQSMLAGYETTPEIEPVDPVTLERARAVIKRPGLFQHPDTILDLVDDTEGWRRPLARAVVTHVITDYDKILQF